MNKQIAVIGLIVALGGAYLFSLSSVAVLSEFDVVPTNSFITYYSNVSTLPLPLANYRMELINTNQGPEFINGEEVQGHPIDLYVFDDENYEKFKKCGGTREGAEICNEWEPIMSQMELTGVYRRSLNPEIDRLTIVVWNLNTEKTVDNSIAVRLESNYSGVANILVIIGLLVFYIGLSRKEEKPKKNINNKNKKE
uniref:Uncharacterized protein n=1 Tax=uncultured marine thaumarchaeote KM3_100_D10 TaxID=1455979 RepID=A0A075G483_9ARCH|nr:hypothetical protein [uncultured marine thaumarchaeote KM3_100_D10]